MKELVWAEHWKMWWQPRANGYTTDLLGAGVFERGEVAAAARRRFRSGFPPGHPVVSSARLVRSAIRRNPREFFRLQPDACSAT